MPRNRITAGGGDRRLDAALPSATARHRAEADEVQLHADQSVAYRVVAETLADASKAGLTRIGFVSQPEAP